MNDFLDLLGAALVIILVVCVVIGIPLGILWISLLILTTFWQVILGIIMIVMVVAVLKRV